MPKIHYTRFPVTSAGKLPTCCQLQVVVMEFGKRHDTTDFCPRQLVTDLMQTCRLCCGIILDLLQGSHQLGSNLLWGNWCNGFWPLRNYSLTHFTTELLPQTPRCSW